MDLLGGLKSREAVLQGIAVAGGIGLHVKYFNHGRHSARTPRYTLVTISILLMAGLHRFTLPDANQLPLLGLALRAALSFLLGIYSSLLFYRLFLSPLNVFPGPKAARISDLWLTFQSRHLDWHERSLALSRKYGPYVRIGSSSLLVVDPVSVPAIFGSQSKCVRAEFYGVFNATHGIASFDTNAHRERRRIWSQAFGPSAMRDYEARIGAYVDKFVCVLEKAATQGNSLDITKWGAYYAWDLMGDVGLAKDFSLMQTGKDHWAMELLTGSMEMFGLRMPNWLLVLLTNIPGSQKAIMKFFDYCNTQLDSQIQETVDGKRADSKASILDNLIAHIDSSKPSLDDIGHLRSDCQVIIVAGSDTTASTLVFILYYLAKQPRDVAKLRQELLPLMRNGVFKHTDIQNAGHLNGIINEALRLWPPGSVIPRETPPEGVKVGETYIPGNVTIYGSQYVLGRSEEVYPKPLEFIPERWYERPELVKDKDAYAPFNIGPHLCIGKPLALMELRMLIANVVMRFDVEFASPRDASNFTKVVRDAHTWRLPELMLRFSPVDSGKFAENGKE